MIAVFGSSIVLLLGDSFSLFVCRIFVFVFMFVFFCVRASVRAGVLVRFPYKIGAVLGFGVLLLWLVVEIVCGTESKLPS